MSVELKVTLVGEDPQQQAAFNDPAPVASNTPSIPPVQPATLPSPPPVQSSAVASTGGSHSEVTPPPVQSTEPSSQAASIPPPLPAWHVQAPPVQGQEQRLIDSIDQLIESIDALTGISTQQRNPRSQPATQPGSQAHQSIGNVFEKIAQSIDKKLDDLGVAHTSVGNMVSNLTHLLTGAGSRVTKAASTFIDPMIGRAAGGVASRAAAGAATEAAAGVAAAGAGEAAAAGAGMAAVAAATNPVTLALVGFAAGVAATALTVKMFMDAVEAAANELEDLSPQIANVRAQHQVSLELARLDRAKRIGGDVAEIEQARNRINESMYEVQTKLYELALKATPVAEKTLDAMNVLIRLVDVGVGSVNAGFAALTDNEEDDKTAADKLGESMGELASAINVFKNGDTQPADIDPVFKEVLEFSPIANKKDKAPNKGNGLRGGQ